MDFKNKIINQSSRFISPKISQHITLYTSLSTLICCALPSLLVMLGFGVVFSSLISVFPQIIWLSENKTIVFTISGFMILINWMIYLNTKNKIACEINETKKTPTACQESKSFSSLILYISTGFWITGFFFAFLVNYFI